MQLKQGKEMKSGQASVKDAVLIFEKFREQCIWLREVYNTYNLFDPSKYSGDEYFNVEDIYRKTAPVFFNVIFSVVHEYLLLQVARITDPAAHGDNANLSVQFVNGLVADMGKDTDEIKSLSEKMHCFAKPIRLARNKIISHVDGHAIFSDEPLGGHADEQAWQTFMADLQQYTDTVGRILGVGPSDFTGIGRGPGDSTDLIRYLRAGIAFHGGGGPFGMHTEKFYKWAEERKVADDLLSRYAKE